MRICSGWMALGMDDMESQAMSLINDMMAAVPVSAPAPAQYNFDVWA